MVRLHEDFEWDDRKAEVNLRKHGISFDDAAAALEDSEGDAYHIDLDDPSHADGEDRFVTYASMPGDRRQVLIISWTDRSTQDERITRIIGARKASKKERQFYVEQLGG